MRFQYQLDITLEGCSFSTQCAPPDWIETERYLIYLPFHNFTIPLALSNNTCIKWRYDQRHICSRPQSSRRDPTPRYPNRTGTTDPEASLRQLCIAGPLPLLPSRQVSEHQQADLAFLKKQRIPLLSHIP